MKKVVALLGCICILLSAGCMTPLPKQTDGAISVTDTTGHVATLPVSPKKVVVLAPTLAEMYHAVGGDITAMAYVKGRVYPDYITHTEYVGVPYHVNVESLVAQKPDLVIGLNALHSRFTDILAQNHIPYLLFDIATYDDVKETITTMADVAGQKEKGEKILSEMDQRMEETEKKYAKPGITYAAVHGTGQGLFLEAKGSIVCDVADRLGFQNAFPEITMKDIGDKPPFSIEELAVRNPDVIFLTTMVHQGSEEEIFAKSLLTQPAWKEMKAVKNHKVYLLPQNLFLSTPGIDYPKALEYMAERVEGKIT